MTRKQKILITFYLIAFATGLTLAIELCSGDFNLSIPVQWILGIISVGSLAVATCCFASKFFEKK